jgi:hypothetical protein
MMTEAKFEDLMGRAARSLSVAPSIADAVVRRLQQAGAGRPEDWRPAPRLTLWERVSILSPARRAAIIALAIAALAVTGLAAEEAVRKIVEARSAPVAPPVPQPIEGVPSEVTVRFGTEPPIMWGPTLVTSAGVPSTTTTGTTTPSTSTTGAAVTTVYSGTMLASVTLTSSGGGRRAFFTPQQEKELDSLIAQKKYKLLATAETPQGTERLYRFTFSDGSTKDWPLYLPLDELKSLQDYSEKHDAYEARRQGAIRKALLAGRYRLVNVVPFTVHRCLEVASGKTIRVVKIDLPDGTTEAIAEEIKAPPPHSTKEYTFTEYRSTWQEHLDAIKAGRRKLLDAEVTKNYWYEMTLDDGSKTLMSVGGKEPLPDKPPAAPQTGQGPAPQPLLTKEALVKSLREQEGLVRSLKTTYRVDYTPTDPRVVPAIKESVLDLRIDAREPGGWESFIITQNIADNWSTRCRLWREGIKERVESRPSAAAAPGKGKFRTEVMDGVLLHTLNEEGEQPIGKVEGAKESTWWRTIRLTPYSSAFEWFGKPYSEVIAAAEEVAIKATVRNGKACTAVTVRGPKSDLDFVLVIDDQGLIVEREMWGRKRNQLQERMVLEDHRDVKAEDGKVIRFPMKATTHYYAWGEEATSVKPLEYTQNTITVQDIELNVTIPAETFMIKLPPGTKVEDRAH